MGAGGWLLLLIIVACIVALIAAVVKYINSREEWSAEEETESTPKTPITMRKPAGKPEETVNQVNIYVYSAAARKRLCPHCDGENDMTAARCRVCGQTLG